MKDYYVEDLFVKKDNYEHSGIRTIFLHAIHVIAMFGAFVLVDKNADSWPAIIGVLISWIVVSLVIDIHKRATDAVNMNATLYNEKKANEKAEA